MADHTELATLYRHLSRLVGRTPVLRRHIEVLRRAILVHAMKKAPALDRGSFTRHDRKRREEGVRAG